MKTVVAISGSTRKNSSNAELIECIRNISKDLFQIEKYPNVNDLPHFNPDDDSVDPPIEVINFRNLIQNADAILICTPEYAMGVPGSLKNAFDWLVSTIVCSKKPTALITASSQGQKGHASLMETLKVIDAQIIPETELIISFVKTKIVGGKITDKLTEESVRSVLSHLHQLILDKENI